MAKQVWKPGNMLYPVPAVMVTTGDGNGIDDIITIAWTGTINSDPPMVSISVRKSRYSHEFRYTRRSLQISTINRRFYLRVAKFGRASIIIISRLRLWVHAMQIHTVKKRHVSLRGSLRRRESRL